MIEKCYVCNKEEDCRPYGENFQWICYDCGTNEKYVNIVKENFIKQFDSCGNVVILTDSGPVPYVENKEKLN